MTNRCQVLPRRLARLLPLGLPALALLLSSGPAGRGQPPARRVQVTIRDEKPAFQEVALPVDPKVRAQPAFVGNMGSARKKKYSVLGDTVNTVSRIEGLNRELGTGILISASTLAMVKDGARVRDRGEVKVKGKAQPVAIYELEGAGP